MNDSDSSEKRVEPSAASRQAQAEPGIPSPGSEDPLPPPYIPGTGMTRPQWPLGLQHGPGDLLAILRRGMGLFDRGYHWEAHEVWESAWHHEGRRGATADVLKALIKLAAACVKIGQGQPRGVWVHSRRAGELLRSVSTSLEHPPLPLDLDLVRLAEFAEQLAREAELRIAEPSAPPLERPTWRLADLERKCSPDP